MRLCARSRIERMKFRVDDLKIKMISRYRDRGIHSSSAASSIIVNGSCNGYGV